MPTIRMAKPKVYRITCFETAYACLPVQIYRKKSKSTLFIASFNYWKSGDVSMSGKSMEQRLAEELIGFIRQVRQDRLDVSIGDYVMQLKKILLKHIV